MSLLSLISNLYVIINLIVLPINDCHYFQENSSINGNNTFFNIETQKNKNIFPIKKNNDSVGVQVSAKSVLIKDSKTDKILWSKNSEEIRPIASITKLMTAMILLDMENINWEHPAEIRESDINGDFYKIKIYSWEKIKLEDLFKITLMTSSNTGTKILINNTGLSEDEFVKKMNRKAEELNLNNTSFKDPTGLSDENISTASELLQLVKHAFSYPKIKEATSTKTFNFKTLNSNRYINVRNTNDLIGGYLNIKAGKTGYTDAAGFCLMSEITYQNKGPILVVVLGSESHYERFSDLKAISTWVFDNYEWQ